MSSGNNSIYVNQLNDDDLYLLFNPLANEGTVEISMDLRNWKLVHTLIFRTNLYQLLMKFLK